ncbi:MAG: hypothetical protein KDA75_16085 [Planctomycetaceae bacterium]|nr:hypothetical protein [Planctomycetaceae bacterium]
MLTLPSFKSQFAFTTLLLALVTAPLLACPFCEAPDVTLTQQVHQSDVAVLVQWVEGRPMDREASFAGSTTYEVLDVLHDSSGTLEKGSRFDIVRYRAGKSGDMFLMLGSYTTKIEWGSPIEVTETSYNYIKLAPTKEASARERLSYFVKFLEYSDRLIADDAYAEFAGAPYEDILLIVDQMPREKLREWITDPKTPVNRLGLYGLMLGLCGQPDDTQLMEQKILEPNEGFRIGIDGIMTGYVLIGGEPALQLLEKEKLSDRTEDFSEHVACAQMLRFLWTYGKDKFPPERLRQSMRLLVENPKIADLVIPDLARWEDWELTPRLIALYGAEGYDVPFVQRKFIHFMWAAIDSIPKDAEKTPDYVLQAKEFVDKLEAEDPDLVRMAKKTYFR